MLSPEQLRKWPRVVCRYGPLSAQTIGALSAISTIIECPGESVSDELLVDLFACGCMRLGRWIGEDGKVKMIFGRSFRS